MNDDEIDEDDARLIAILGVGEDANEPALVSPEMLDRYFKFLQPQLSKNLRLTGRETMGYFAWEEGDFFDVDVQAECPETGEERASCNDKFKLILLKNTNQVWTGLTANVKRMSDDKIFDIPLADLVIYQERLKEYQLLEDYGSWIVNYNEEDF